ncbi:zinc ribbon domain-containing protein [Mycobacterium sp. ITM-2016-00317]|uniref:zinc ribbon domain-containing protein n=1 Tax=Mycobacterium sp. ITM-2016-00317 TaxID=2099694 RepID=UPI00287FC3AF|nr:zinc ribbon domain-containing protein [Mycobacterium sp. ITM-2016-00317]WNG87641.1 zinc ribbon domain-containing protein [Mycobacterium sp. ITM-2016-00317]
MTAPGMMECQVCQMAVPAGEYCGYCGMPLADHRDGRGPHWLRKRAFSAAPGQRLLSPALTSSLFPHLPPRSRKVFLMGLGLLAVALAVTTFLRMPAALTAVASTGLPLLFALYLRESGVSRDIPRSTLVLTTALGAILGVGWVLLTGVALARAYGVPLGAGIAGGRILRDGIGVPVGSMLLMLVPALVARWSWQGDREALDGYAIGALGALTFTAAATLTRLAPQFTTGMVNRARPLDGLLVEAGIRGVTMPLTAAAVGGLIGTALWFTRPPNKALQNRGFIRGTLVLIAVVVIAIYASLGVVDVARFPQLWQLALHLTLTGIALFALRVGLHLALLYETQDEIHTDEPILCVECNHVVPDAAFCARCGAAMHASSRRSRRSRREDRPIRLADDPVAGEITVGLLPGYSLQSGTFEATQPPKTSFRKVALAVGATTVLLAGALVGVSGLISKPAPKYICPPECGSPPINLAVEINPRFTSADGAFSVSYPVAGAAYEVSQHDNGITAVLQAGDGGTMQLFSRPAGGRSAQEIATALVNETFPDTKTAYEIPNTMVGYQHGYGLAADLWPQGAMTSSTRMRVIVMVAVKNDLALIAGAVGPYRAFGPDFGSGKPSAANLQLALDMGKYVNSFSWRGDPPR